MSLGRVRSYTITSQTLEAKASTSPRNGSCSASGRRSRAATTTDHDPGQIASGDGCQAINCLGDRIAATTTDEVEQLAARDETREPRIRMRDQANLLRGVCCWALNEHLTKPGRIFA
jgi:hypothetical protein